MASEIIDNDDGFPWLSWALTGVLALAGVLVVGLVISARNPRSQRMPPSGGTAEAAKSPLRPPAATESPPADPASAVGALPSGSGPSPAAAAEPAVTVETLPPKTTPAPPAPAGSNAGLRVSAPPPPGVPPVNGPASPPPSATVPPRSESISASPAPATQDPLKRAVFVRAVGDIRAAMGQRNLAACKRDLLVAAANAQGAADQAELERLQALHDHLEQFWDGIRRAVAAMQPIDEIVLSNSNRVAVIEASREELAVQREGRPQRGASRPFPSICSWQSSSHRSRRRTVPS